MSVTDDLKITEQNMTKMVNEKKKEVQDLRKHAEDLRKQADEVERQAKDDEKQIAFMMTEMGALRKNAEAAIAAEQRFQEKS